MKLSSSPPWWPGQALASGPSLALSLALSLSLTSGAAGAAPPAAAVQGVVTQVIDGDTLVITTPGKPPQTVRLRDIDAPEICQPGGAEARRALTDLALNKPAVQRGGAVLVGDVNLGLRMVEDGHAWSVRTRYDQGPLVKQERVAKALGRGLHGTAGALMPRDFRKAHGPCPGQ